MADTLFDIAAEQLEHHAGIDRLEARGTLRIALKAAGLDSTHLTGAQLQVVFEKVMPAQLKKCGVTGAEDVCVALIAELASAGSDAENARASSAEDIFRRLSRT